MFTLDVHKGAFSQRLSNEGLYAFTKYVGRESNWITIVTNTDL